MESLKKRLLIIDANSVIHRAYHALPRLTTEKGELVNAIYGFLLVFFKAIKEFQPDYIVATFDFPAPTFRHKKFKEYKITRPPAPEELYQQIPKVKEVLKSFDVPVFEKEGFEADDLIGTIAHLSPKRQVVPEIETIILTGDLDTLQLVDWHTKVYALSRGVKEAVLYDRGKVQQRYGISPKQLTDFKALKGDPSDNIPGVPGIGEKTAIELIKEFGSLENLYQNLAKLKPKLKESLLLQKEQAFLSKELAEIKTNVPIDFNLKKCQWREYDKEKITKILSSLEFQSLIKRLPESKWKKEKVGKELTLW